MSPQTIERIFTQGGIQALKDKAMKYVMKAESAVMDVNHTGIPDEQLYRLAHAKAVCSKNFDVAEELLKYAKDVEEGKVAVV